jgi:hypothetical protein
MRKALVFMLLIALTVTFVACGGGEEDNGEVTDNGTHVDMGDKNPNEGRLVTNDPGDDENALVPVKDDALIGELKVPPHPVSFWTCYEVDGLDVVGNMFEGWEEVDKTKESWDAGIVRTFEYINNPELTWNIAYEMVPGKIQNEIEYFEENVTNYIGDAEIIEDGRFRHTESMATGYWVEYTKDDMKGRKLFYMLRGERLSETEFGDAFGVICTAEGPANIYDEAWEKGNLNYMFQEVMVTQPMAQ